MKWPMSIWGAFSAVILALLGMNDVTPAALAGASVAGFGVGWVLGRGGDALIARYVAALSNSSAQSGNARES